MLVDRVLLAPWRAASRAVQDLDALAEAVRELPRIERRLSGQLSSLLTRIGEIAMHVEAIPEPLATIARELPPVGSDVGALRSDLDRVTVLVEGVRGDVAGVDPRIAAVERLIERLSTQIAGVHADLHTLAGTVTAAAEQLPEPDDGIIARARDALTGSSAT